jgi:hypothetical protein
MISDIWQKIVDLIQQTHVVEQIKAVDTAGLLENPWFMIPFVGLCVYLVYKKAWRDIVILAIFIGVWWFSGTEYMQTIFVKGEINVGKILPIIGGGAVALAVVIYLIFGRSD